MCMVVEVGIRYIVNNLTKKNEKHRDSFSAGKIAKKSVCKSVFVTIWHCILIITKTHFIQTVFFGDFVHWVKSCMIIMLEVEAGIYSMYAVLE